MEFWSKKNDAAARREKRRALEAKSPGAHTRTWYDDDGNIIGEVEYIENVTPPE